MRSGRAFTRRTIEFAVAGIGVSLVRSATLRIPTLEESIRNDRYPTQELSGLGPIHRLIAPAAVADSAAWLCSDRSQRSCSHALMVADRFRVSLGLGPSQLERKSHSKGGLEKLERAYPRLATPARENLKLLACRVFSKTI